MARRSRMTALTLLLAVGLCTLTSTPTAHARRAFLPLPLQLHSFPRLRSVELSVAPADPSAPSSQPPVFFFHGVLSSARDGYHYAQNLTADGRVVVSLHFCSGFCSVQALPAQVELAVAAIREVIQADPVTFQDGYVFIAHSQGGALARAVIEEMDDHQVTKFISLAGAQNGIFFGPQPEDQLPLLAFVYRLGPVMIPPRYFDFSRYSMSDFRGIFQYDLMEAMLQNADGQLVSSGFNLMRPAAGIKKWIANNPFLPVINNINTCDISQEEEEEDSDGNAAMAACRDDQRRRRSNFLRLHDVHFFASPNDGIISPWQSSVLGQYAPMATTEAVRDQFDQLTILNMTQTREYIDDTYGLRTLDERGAVTLHVVPGVEHSCWVADTLFADSHKACHFLPIYEEHIYPLLR